MKRKYEQRDYAPMKRTRTMNSSRKLVVPRFKSNAVNQYRTGGFLPAQQGVRGYGAAETKTMDLPITSTQIEIGTGTTLATCLNVSYQGTGYNQRIGNKIHMKSLYFNAFFATNTVQATADYARLIIVYDRQANATLPNYSDVITSIQSNSSSTTSSSCMDNVNLTNKDRFKILMDERVYLPILASSTDTTQVAMALNSDPSKYIIKRYIKLGLETQYKASSGAIGDITTGSIVFFTQGLNANGSNGYSISWTSRIRFSDL